MSRPLPFDRLPPAERRPATRYRHSKQLWLAVQLLEPAPAPAEIESLATWAQRLTPEVVPQAGQGLLLEVHGSLRLFGGLGAIKQALADELDRRQWLHRMATAPTPLAASWLARCRAVDVTELDRLLVAIGNLPLAATAWPSSVQTMLGQMGLRSIAECLRLPRDGFARRIGQAYLDDLDRALGKVPDIRQPHRAEQRYERTVDFMPETFDRARFVEAVTAAVNGFALALRRRQAQVREIELRFAHLRHADTVTHLRFVDPVHTRERLLNPLLARLEQVSVAEPVVALTVATGPLLPLEVERPALPWVAGGQQATPEFALVECLRGRFGEHRVYGIAAVDQHRPEHAWRRWLDRPQPPQLSMQQVREQERPLWLLPEPVPQSQQGQTPSEIRWGLTPSAPASSPAQQWGFERIESGWWDGQDVRRDYQIVVGAGGEKLWVYRDCATQQWYLHGLFG
ncbi:MAG: DNA polymerase Y family protein [Gammaproteobacteria bacterium]|nr:DNA polymerase Y family protein [Gammaproteobacteria bacterium]